MRLFYNKHVFHCYLLCLLVKEHACNNPANMSFERVNGW